jgi:hypothetical protein
MNAHPTTKNCGLPSNHTCNNGTASPGNSPPFLACVRSWISQSPLRVINSLRQTTKNRKISTSTSHRPLHIQRAYSMALSPEAFSYTTGYALTHRTPTSKHNDYTPTSSNEAIHLNVSSHFSTMHTAMPQTTYPEPTQTLYKSANKKILPHNDVYSSTSCTTQTTHLHTQYNHRGNYTSPMMILLTRVS